MRQQCLQGVFHITRVRDTEKMCDVCSPSLPTRAKGRVNVHGRAVLRRQCARCAECILCDSCTSHAPHGGVHPRLPSTIPFKIQGFFDGNLCAYCISNESAASDPFELQKRAIAKGFKIPGILPKTNFHTLRFDFSFKNSPNLSAFEMRNSRHFFIYFEFLLRLFFFPLKNIFFPFINIYIFIFIKSWSLLKIDFFLY